MISLVIKLVKYLIVFMFSISAAGCNVQKADGEKEVSSPIDINFMHKKISKIDYEKFSGLNMQKDNINLNIEGNKLALKLPIYIDKNRYYIPLTEIIDKLGGQLKEKKGVLNLKVFNEESKIDLNNNIFKDNNGKEIRLKKDIIKKEGIYYISFIDFSNMMNFHTRWNHDSKTIKAYVNKEKLAQKKYESKLETMGFLRLEDIATSNDPEDDEKCERLRVMARFLNDRSVPYHIAWVPRYKAPKINVDVDPSKENGFSIADFIYTLDYITYHGGQIGLHGYTHQRGSEYSLLGTEFGPDDPDVEDFRQRVEAAIKIAKDLDIPITFFETPHYAITAEQNKALEDYFTYIYHPFKDSRNNSVYSNQPLKSPNNNKSYYLTTPLDYVKQNGTNEMISRIRNLSPNTIASLFYHPGLEYRYINLTEEDGIPKFQYDENAPLKRIIDELEKRGYKMSFITDIR
ncbi:hypothetical protein CPJCM30710_14340 [Clostridium polyendosporum]|uniref:Copper amine oxidase-like N-terminal domain-containing protein n=1 Tax=Clostridium polyendosporum TaxID=69208 RepID=A0A919S015_9CLOT|nr:DUF2334 domain-containing protein [Clostridium polyendosporum]GIM28768.1 hypothetical protein CPJCM30710_14340 [Clostridium polyendosporum]